MASPEHSCDHCHLSPGDTYFVDSLIGLEAWNHRHPDDQRTQLHFCSLLCVFVAGYELGMHDG